MNYLSDLLSSFFQTLPSVVTAALILLLAWLAASISKQIVVKGLKKIKVEKYTDKIGITDETTGSSLEFIGKLVFAIIFLLFLPAVLDKLGMRNVSAPITTLVSQFLNYIPNIIAAVIILVIGLFVANIIRQLLTPVLKRFNVDKIQERAGIATSESTTISSVISYVVYVLILVPVIIAALQVLNIPAISDPAIDMLNKIIVFLPNIFVAIAIIIIGSFIAKIVGKLLSEILAGVGTDAAIQKAIPTENSKLKQFSFSKVVGEIVKYIILLLFVVEAINVLKLEVLQFVGAAIISYLPFAISAIIIMGVAFFLATWVEGLLVKKFPNNILSAIIAKYIILAFAVFMTLNQLGIAPSIVTAAFIIILGALAIAFAIAFGMGGREFATGVLKKFESTLNSNNSQEKK